MKFFLLTIDLSGVTDGITDVQLAIVLGAFAVLTPLAGVLGILWGSGRLWAYWKSITQGGHVDDWQAKHENDEMNKMGL